MKNTEKNIDARQRMIGAAFELFHKYGVHGTSVDTVLGRSRTGKSQFSHYFENKEGLVRAVFEHFHEELKTGAYDAVKSIRTWNDLRTWLRSFITWQKSVECTMSCPIATIGNDLAGDHKDLRRLIRDILNWRRDFIARFFREEQAKGAMRKDVAPEVLADFCYAVLQGGMLMAKVERTTKPFEHALDTLFSYLKTLRLTQRKSARKR